MTNEEIIELAHEAGFPRDTIFYRSDQFITFANAIAQRTREECAEKFEEMQSNGDAWVSTVAASAAIRSMTK